MRRNSGSDRECATVRVAFGTLAGAIDRLVFDLRVQRDEILLVHQAAIAQGDILERHDAALKVSDRIREIGDPFTPCLALLQQVCVKAPQACLEGHPIEESGLGSIGSRLDFVAKEFGRPQFKFRGDASKPRAFLESTRQGLLMIRGLWADYLRDIQTSLDPPPKRYSPIP